MAPLISSLGEQAFYFSHSLKPALLSWYPDGLPPLSVCLAPLSKGRVWYAGADPMHSALSCAALLSFIVWILGEVTGNVSQVDRLWTFLPLLYSAHFTFYPYWSGTGQVQPRMLLVFGLQVLWSARLTTNTYRRGFFNPKSEDYRWEVVRATISVPAFKILNFTFIAIYQNLLLLAAELPQYLLLTLPPHFNQTLQTSDYVLSALFILILVLEMVADNQQQTYQNFKIRARKGKARLSPVDEGRLERGFVTEGLWSVSRHPNFACEQSTWFVLYLFTVLPFLPSGSHKLIRGLLGKVVSVKAGKEILVNLEGILWNYSIASPLLMSSLFYGSTWLTELISTSKYPLYKVYQKRVGMFWYPVTLAKTIWLGLTGQLASTNEIVFGSVLSQDQVDRKTL